VRLIGGPTEPLEPYFVQFNAATPKLRNMTIRQRVGLVEASAIRELRSRIKERQDCLIQAFSAHDPQGRGDTRHQIFSLTNKVFSKLYAYGICVYRIDYSQRLVHYN